MQFHLVAEALQYEEAMRTRLSDATTRVKEVREFPMECDQLRMRVGEAECAGLFKGYNQ